MHMKTLFSILLLAASSVFAAPPPSAKEILESVRLRQAQQELNLHGEIREGPTIVPFRLTQSGPLIRYSFSNPDEALQLRLGENESRLEEVTEEGVEKVAPAQFDRKVRGTGITYEDLALRFLYWQTGRVTGENEIRTVSCWKLEMKAPSRQSQYSNVWLWVGKGNGALMKMEAYDWNAKLLKRFEVVSGQKIEGRWFLKEMRIEELDPGTGKVKTRTYLDIKK
jgi:Outer membrane lipoprotein-sorting protein